MRTRAENDDDDALSFLCTPVKRLPMASVLSATARPLCPRVQASASSRCRLVTIIRIVRNVSLLCATGRRCKMCLCPCLRESPPQGEFLLRLAILLPPKTDDIKRRPICLAFLQVCNSTTSYISSSHHRPYLPYLSYLPQITKRASPKYRK